MKEEEMDVNLEVMAVICEVYSEALANIARYTREGRMTLALGEWQKMKKFQQPLKRVDELMKKHFRL